MRAPSRLLVLFLSAGLPAGCADPLGPDEVAGTYVLQKVAGDTLPALLSADLFPILFVFGDTLRLTAHGRGTAVKVVKGLHPEGGSPTGPVRLERAFSFRIVSGRIEIPVPCPWPADCSGPLHLVARPYSDGLRVYTAPGERVPQTYARLASSP